MKAAIAIAVTSLMLSFSPAFAEDAPPAAQPNSIAITFMKEWALFDGQREHVIASANAFITDYQRLQKENEDLKMKLKAATQTPPSKP